MSEEKKTGSSGKEEMKWRNGDSPVAHDGNNKRKRKLAFQNEQLFPGELPLWSTKITQLPI